MQAPLDRRRSYQVNIREWAGVGGGFDFSQGMFGTDYRSQLRLQYLERDFTLVLEVVGQVDRGHPALTDLTLDGLDGRGFNRESRRSS